MSSAGRARVLRWAAIAATAVSSTLLFAGPADAAAPVVLGGGSGVYVEDFTSTDTVSDCTLTAVGYDNKNQLVGLTAGHCGEVGARVAAEYTRSGGIGVIAERSDQMDWAVIVFNPEKVTATRQVAQSVINSVGTPPQIGESVCKNGRTTGFTCGPVWETKALTFRSQVCANHGDSGAPVLRGDQLVGMVVAGTDFKAGPIDVELPLCEGGGNLIHEPELSTNITAVLADIDRHGGAGAGFHIA
ncbi:S1 family peptidase [Nocardia sp. CDC153]|uniref:S1 family peptidase n=1 Tax=Nocardia sp. CDC153 TaxID=3112167 RepID=UPI002DBE3981|nr:S1 family peptidase [Nocardia sp. CDC153]MEC3955788.1 S1 family peptidase [Nocardia sp. CDC153]